MFDKGSAPGWAAIPACFGRGGLEELLALASGGSVVSGDATAGALAAASVAGPGRFGAGRALGGTVCAAVFGTVGAPAAFPGGGTAFAVVFGTVGALPSGGGTVFGAGSAFAGAVLGAGSAFANAFGGGAGRSAGTACAEAFATSEACVGDIGRKHTCDRKVLVNMLNKALLQKMLGSHRVSYGDLVGTLVNVLGNQSKLISQNTTKQNGGTRQNPNASR